MSYPQQKAILSNTSEGVVQCDHLKLCAVLEKSGHKQLPFTAWGWSLLKELDILKPSDEGTDLTTGEKIVTISAVVPSFVPQSTP